MVRLKASSFAPSAPPIPAPVDESLEIAQQMRPADLPQLYPLVRGPAVDHEEAAEILAEHLLGDARAAAPGDLEDGHQCARRGPEPSAAFGLAPAGLVGVHHRLLAHVLAGFLDWGRKRLADFALDVADRAERQPDAKKVREQLLRHPLAQTIAAGADRDQRLEPRPERRRGLGRQLAARARSAFLAGQLVLLIFGHVRPDWRHLDHLRTARLGVPARQSRPAPTAARRHALHNFAHLLRWQQFTLVVLVARLPASLSTARLTLAARRPGQIRRRRPRRIA